MEQKTEIQLLEKLFLQRVDADSSPVHRTMGHYRWFTTSMIKDSCFPQLSLAQVRRKLRKLFTEKLVICKHHKNYILWSVATIPGFKETKYKDYFILI